MVICSGVLCYVLLSVFVVHLSFVSGWGLAMEFYANATKTHDYFLFPLSYALYFHASIMVGFSYCVERVGFWILLGVLWRDILAIWVRLYSFDVCLIGQAGEWMAWSRACWRFYLSAIRSATFHYPWNRLASCHWTEPMHFHSHSFHLRLMLARIYHDALLYISSISSWISNWTSSRPFAAYKVATSTISNIR